PSIQSACLTLRSPMEAQGFKLPFQIQGQPSLPEEDLPQIVVRPITSDYFKTVSIPLVSGRDFSEQDHTRAAPVAIVNQTFTKTFFPQSGSLGQRLQSKSLKGKSALIVGVVADVLPEAGAASRPSVYLPFSQFPVPGMSLLVRTTGEERSLVPTIRDRIWALNPDVPLDKSYMLEQKVSE